MRVLLFALLAGAALPEREWRIETTSIVRHYDEEAGVVCYIVPADRCAGPAISCIKLKEIR